MPHTETRVASVATKPRSMGVSELSAGSHRKDSHLSGRELTACSCVKVSWQLSTLRSSRTSSLRSLPCAGNTLTDSNRDVARAVHCDRPSGLAAAPSIGASGRSNRMGGGETWTSDVGEWAGRGRGLELALASEPQRPPGDAGRANPGGLLGTASRRSGWRHLCHSTHRFSFTLTQPSLQKTLSPFIVSVRETQIAREGEGVHGFAAALPSVCCDPPDPAVPARTGDFPRAGPPGSGGPTRG